MPYQRFGLMAVLRLSLAIFAGAFGLLATSSKSSADPLIIEIEGQAPRVHCSLAEKMTGTELWKLLKRSHIVFFDGEGYACGSEVEVLKRKNPIVADIPLINVPGAGGTPWCYCRHEVQLKYMERLKDQKPDRYNQFVLMGTGSSFAESWGPDQRPEGVSEEMAVQVYRSLQRQNFNADQDQQIILQKFENSVLEHLGSGNLALPAR